MKKIIKSYYGFQLFFNLIMWLPVFYEIQKRIGLNDHDIFGIQSIYYFAFLFLEIPTGSIADRWGYRSSLRLGAMSFLIANLTPILIASYSGFLIHFLLIALARSLISGAAGAYLYDHLKAFGEEKSYKEIEGKARSIGLIAKIICWTAVTYLMKYNLFMPYYLTALSGLIAVFYSLSLPADLNRINKKNIASQTQPPNFLSACKEIIASPMLLLLMIQGTALFTLARLIEVNLFQPILNSKSFDLSYHGAILAVMTGFEAFGSAKSKFLAAKASDLKVIYYLTTAVAFSFLLIAFSSGIGTVISLCVFSLALGLSFPIQKQLINDHITGPSRATILSIESIIDRLVVAIAVLPIGSLLNHGKLTNALIYASIFSFIGATIIYKYISTKKREEVPCLES